MRNIFRKNSFPDKIYKSVIQRIIFCGNALKKSHIFLETYDSC